MSISTNDIMTVVKHLNFIDVNSYYQVRFIDVITKRAEFHKASSNYQYYVRKPLEKVDNTQVYKILSGQNTGS